MKLKQLPQDFLVEEIPSISISPEKDAQAIFLLEKQEIDTFDAIRNLARKLQISLFDIGYAGLKDKHSIAKQYVSIPAQYNVQDITTESFRLHFLGYHQKKIKIGDLKGNRFQIIARDIHEDLFEQINKRGATLPISGVPNYYDSQRFGSVIHNVFIAKLLIQKHYEQAVKQYLTTYQKSEPKIVKNEKRRILAHWNNFEHLYIGNKTFSRIIKEFLKTHDWCAAYGKLPANIREIHMNAYQSYLWNECIKQVLNNSVKKKKLYPVPYAVGYLLFYDDLVIEERCKIPDTFPTLSESVQFSVDEKPIIHSVLNRERIALKDMSIVTSVGNFFKSRQRPVCVIPEKFTLSGPLSDEMNDSRSSPRYKFQISFELPKGSYATLVTKRLFGQ
jgi:tRNA pseudouridine13 synthase